MSPRLPVGVQSTRANRLFPVLGWLRRRGSRRGAALPPRSDAVEVVRVELADLRPEPVAYLGRLAYFTLVLAENLGRAVTAAPTAGAKSRLAHAAADVLTIHEGVMAELRARSTDPEAAMELSRPELDDFQRRTAGTDWHEILITCYLAGGFLLDFFDGLAAGLPDDLAERIEALLDGSEAEGVLQAELRAAVEDNPRLAARLALWGRRLVGDCMLVARSSMTTGGVAPGQERTEPVFTELIATHTRRMDSLGLTP